MPRELWRAARRWTLWTTFTPRQLDIDVQHALGKRYLTNVLDTLAAAGVSMIRLDAVGYAIKKAGTSCFMLPETFDFIRAMAADGRALGIEVLVEVHSYYARQIEIARHVDWVYDFALPPLVLHAFAFGTARNLKKWIGMRPSNAITVLDTHDGIGIVDVGADQTDREGRPGTGVAWRDRRPGRTYPRRKRRPEPPCHGRGSLESRSLSGELHLLRRNGTR